MTDRLPSSDGIGTGEAIAGQWLQIRQRRQVDRVRIPRELGRLVKLRRFRVYDSQLTRYDPSAEQVADLKALVSASAELFAN